MLAPITDPCLKINPSKKLIAYIKTLVVDEKTPENIKLIIKGRPVCKSGLDSKSTTPSSPSTQKFLIEDEDINFINSLELSTKKLSSEFPQKVSFEEEQTSLNQKCLSVGDLHWLNEKMDKSRREGKTIYIHELLENCEILLPKNEVIPRNPELEKRCEQLKAQHANKEYKAMTRNIDGSKRIMDPHDTIAYQVKQMNRQLIAIAQFIMSVLAGFAFGFIGIELIVGNLDFGFRLLLGIICSLVIALAELYFLAKKLNEDVTFDTVRDESKLWQNSKTHID